MKFKSSQICALLGLLSLLVSSCASSGHLDAVNPTVSEMDKLDKQWGLPPRVAKGTPHKYPASTASQAVPAGAGYSQPAASATQTPVSQPAASSSQPAPITVDPSVIQKLR